MVRHRGILFSAAALRRAFAGTALLLLATAASAQVQSFRWTTIAGGDVGDGLPATNAVVADPVGIAVDAQGYVYLAQAYENRIRRISPGGAVIETIAGDGTLGYAGDGGAAALARFKRLNGLVIDADGNLYVADSGNRRVRKITAAGTITTVAGNGTFGYSGDGGPATGAAMMEPYGLALDAAGNLYVSDSFAHVVRKIAPDGRVITVAGTGTRGFSGDGGAAASARLASPRGISVDAAGNLYIADQLNQRIRRVTPGGTITTVAGNGSPGSTGDGLPATQASISNPFNVVVAPDGALIISDAFCHLRRVAGGVIDRFAGDGSCEFHGDGGPALQAGIGLTEGMAFDADGDLYFADPEFGRLRRIRAGTGIIDTVAGYGTFAGDGGPAVDAVLSRLRGIAVDPDGFIHVNDAIPNRRIRTIDLAFGTIATTAGNGGWSNPITSRMPALDSSLAVPGGMAAMADGTVLVADVGANMVYAIDRAGDIYPFAGNGSGAFSGDGGLATDAGMDPYAVAVDDVGNVYIADYGNHRVRKVSNGVVTTVAGTGSAEFGGDGGPAILAKLVNPFALAIDSDGGLLIADYGNSRLRKILADGTIKTVAGNGGTVPGGDGGPATAASLEPITGIAVAPDGNLYLATGSVLRRVGADGMITAVPSFAYGAASITFDAEGALLVATESGRVLRGVATTRVRSDFNGDGQADLLWRNASSGENVIWRSALRGVRQSLPTVGTTWIAAGVEDYTGDGEADILWRSPATGDNVLWPSGDRGARRTLASVTGQRWQVAGSGDFDGDGRAELLWRNGGSGENVIWYSADRATRQALPAVGADWIVAGVADYTGDGEADILWRSPATGGNVLWPSGDRGARRTLASVTGQRWQVAGSGDFDGDGRADLLWRNGGSGENVIWYSADRATRQALPAVGAEWIVASVADYTGDGAADIVWRSTASGGNVLWPAANRGARRTLASVTSQQWQVVP